AALTGVLQWATRFFSDSVNSRSLPASAHELEALIIPRHLRTTALSLPLGALEGEIDQQRREHSAQQRPYLRTPALSLRIPAVHFISNLEEFLHRLAEPFWASSSLE